MRIATELQLTADQRSALFYALLMKDLGCSSNAARFAVLFGADDQRVKADLKTTDSYARRPTIDSIALPRRLRG